MSMLAWLRDEKEPKIVKKSDKRSNIICLLSKQGDKKNAND